MILKELKINNFISHENTTITFKENEKVLLDGRSGSGKSGIIEAILWCFYGKGRTENRSLIRRGAKSASVFLKLSERSESSDIRTSEVAITRTISSTGKNTLVVTKNTGTNQQFLPIERVGLKDTQEWIEKELLKASFELFTNSIAYPQENENSFVKSNASRRKDLLLEIVRADKFDELYDKTRRFITANELDSAVAVSKIENFETTIKNSEEIAGKYDLYKKEVDETSIKIESYLKIEKELEKQVNEVSKITREIEFKKSELTIVETIICLIDTQIATGQKTIIEHQKIDIETARKNVKEMELLIIESEKIEKELKDNAEAQQKINAHLSNKPLVFDYSKDIELINKRLIPLIKDSSKCPAGDACPFVIPIKGQIEFLEKQIEEKTQKTVEEQQKITNWGKEMTLLPVVKDTLVLYGNLKDIKDKIKVLVISNDVIVQYESFEKTLSEILKRELDLKIEKEKYGKNLTIIDIQTGELVQKLVNTDINKINVELSTLRVTMQQLQKVRDNALANVALATNAQEIIKNTTTELQTLKKEVKKTQEEKESLELLKEALSPRGIKAVVVDWLIPQLEEKINDILGQLSDFRIRLDTQQSKVNEEDGMKEGLFITVINGQGEEMSYENFSGGEKIKITIAISEALASLMNQVGFRIIDEAITSLDNESTESFVEVLIKLQEKFPQVIAISHIPEVKDVFEKQIMVTKINGISKIT